MYAVIFVVGVGLGVFVGVLGMERLRGRILGGAAKFEAVDGASSEELKAARQARSERAEKRKSRIVAVVQHEGKITNDGVEDLYCISDSTASRYLSELVDEGKLVREGVGRGTFYTLPK